MGEIPQSAHSQPDRADSVLFSRGDATTIGFTNYRTRIHALDF